MILKGWHIESYGIFSDWTLDDLGGGITVFHGLNEAGKSTLLHFVRGVLFRYPGKAQDGYVPNLGSRVHGGRLFLENNEGRWTLDRSVQGNRATLTRPDGTQAEPSELEVLLHHADKTLFKSVFTFELSDLVGMEGKDAQKVRDRLFSAGISGAGKSASELGALLASEMESLYKKQGRTQKLNILLSKIDEQEALRKKLIAAAKEYPQEKIRLEGLSAKAASLKQERDEQAAKLAKLTLLEKLWPLLRDRKAIEEKLSALDAPASFPSKGIPRMEAQLEKRDEAALEIKDLQRDKDTLEAQRALLATDATLTRQGGNAKLLTETLPAHAERLKQLRELDRDADLSLENLQRTLRAIGNRWTRELLLEIDTGTERTDAVELLGRELSSVSDELAFAKRALNEHNDDTVPPKPNRFLLPITLTGSALLLALGVYLEGEYRIAAWIAAALMAVLPFLRKKPKGSDDEALVEKQAHAEATFARIEASWNEALRDWGLTDGGSVASDTAMHLITKLRSAKREEGDLKQKETKARHLRQEVQRWENSAATSLKLAAQLEGEALVVAVREAITAIAAELDKQQRFDALTAKLVSVDAAIAKQLDHKNLAQDKLTALFDEAGVEKDDAFRKHAEIYEQKELLLYEIEKYSAQISTLVGEGEEVDALLEEARSGLVSEWSGGQQDASEGLSALDKELGETNQNLGGLRYELDELENSALLAECQTRTAGLRAQAEALARQWRVAALTRALVRNTLDEYAAENQPEALARASELFSGLTKGRYTRVVHSPEDDQILAVRSTGAQLKADQLSRGTREGLYICLRLALAAQYGDRQGRLPLVMDDVLVNLDPLRAEATLQALACFAEENQVLLFTCHPETVDRVKKVAPDARFVELDGPQTPGT